MLVYANHLSFRGAGAEEAIFKAVGGWLKEQLGFGLHPDQLRQEGEFNGYRGDARSWLRIYATTEEEPELYAWVLKNQDETVRGRQWVTELGLKSFRGALELSCVVRTEEHSTLVTSPVMASRPRVIGYVVNNVQKSEDAEFALSLSAVEAKVVGEDKDSYEALLADIERQDRDCPIVLVSPTRDGEYLVNVADLQQRLIGLGQVVQVSREFNSYEMAEILGQPRSAWSGAVNILHIPSQTGFVRGRLFLSDEILGWGDTQNERISQILAWVTNNTNIIRLRKRVRPEGVMQLALRRRLQALRVRSDQMDASQLRAELEKASLLVKHQEEWIGTLENGNTELESELSDARLTIEDEREKFKSQTFVLQSLKNQLENAGGGRRAGVDTEALLKLACRPDPPTPLECVETIEDLYPDQCVVLQSAKDSARAMNLFSYGRRLLDMLRRLVTDYRGKLLDGGDNEARKVFGKNEYAAKESETVMGNKAMRRLRTFEYDGEQVEMVRHLKIGADENVAKTIRVHFHWDAKRQRIVVGYCGEHFPISSH
ncbi:MAG: hypothetical protein KGN36_04260 [Acidobacteriota bacterium]|nr:hypothetical protein [Acidobacteriota bacterium]